MKQLTLLFLIPIFFLTACEKDRIIGEGDIITEELHLDDIERFALQSSIDVFVSQGSEQQIIAEGHENIIDRLKTSVRNGRWDIELEHGSYRNFSLSISITVPDIREMIIDASGDIFMGEMDLQNLKLRVRGSGDIVSNSSLIVSNKFDIDIEASGDVSLNQVTTPNLEVFIDGSGDLSLNGSATNAEYLIDASGDVKAFGLSSETVSVFSDGSGDTEIMVSDELDVIIRSSGSVYYRGNPNISETITGSGSLINSN